MKIFSIASVSGKSSRMFDYTITIVSPSKTLGYASARVGFSTSGGTIPGDSSSIISRMEKVLDNEGCDGMEVSNEVGVVASYAFSSQDWINSNSSYIKTQLERAGKHVDGINRMVGYQFFEINDPDAGWYILSQFKRRNLPSLIEDSTDLMVYFMKYNHSRDDSGLKARPGCQFGYEAAHLEPLDYLILRSTLAMKPEDLDDFFRRFRDGVLKLAALKELEDFTLERLSGIIKLHDGVKLFSDRMKKALISTAAPADILSILQSGKKAEEICMDLKKVAENEMRIILEE